MKILIWLTNWMLPMVTVTAGGYAFYLHRVDHWSFFLAWSAASIIIVDALKRSYQRMRNK